MSAYVRKQRQRELKRSAAAAAKMRKTRKDPLRSEMGEEEALERDDKDYGAV